MKILVVSDTHRYNDNYLKALKREKPLDMVIHCGDVEGSEYLISEAAGCKTHIVLGNNDFFSDLPRELELTLGKYRALITHGHVYYVSMGNEMIKQEAVSRGCNLVFYGHTHRPVIDVGAEITAVNPGSLSYPRQDGKRPSYIVMTLDEKGDASFELKFL
ncbi:MAG: metallophosphoesterase [Lachnospiraceae bacterium]|nr:metallophosphoesterase [Lachnospiraceae bacterium]